MFLTQSAVAQLVEHDTFVGSPEWKHSSENSAKSGKAKSV